MTSGLDEQVFIVTGGSRGIGRSIVMQALRAGARVAFCARTVDLDGPENTMMKEGRLLAMPADVSSEKDVDRFFDKTLQAFGRIDAVINNAAISKNYLLVDLPLEVWDEVMGTNLTGPFLVARRALSEFIARGAGGVIISLGSVAWYGAPSNVSYATSKGALVGLTKMIAENYSKYNIRANMVVAGYVDAGLSSELPESMKRKLVESCPQRRPASPDEIASVVLFLASSQAAGLNGHLITASGGTMDIVL